MITNRLQALRWKKGWTQRELAKHSGVSHSLICLIENEDRPNPTITNVLLLAEALNVTVEEIFYLTDTASKNKYEKRIRELTKEVHDLKKQNDILHKTVESTAKTIKRLLDFYVFGNKTAS